MYLPLDDEIFKQDVDKAYELFPFETSKWELLEERLNRLIKTYAYTLAANYKDLQDLDGVLTFKFSSDDSASLRIESNYDDGKDWISEEAKTEYRDLPSRFNLSELSSEKSLRRMYLVKHMQQPIQPQGETNDK